MIFFLTLAVGIATGWILHLAIRRLSYQKALRTMHQIMEEAEQPAPQTYDLVPAPLAEAGHGEVPKRVAMVAPFGTCKKMTVRSRMIPMATHLAQLGYNVTIFIPPWDCPESSGQERSLGGVPIVNLRVGKRMPRAFDPVLFVRLFRAVMAFQPDVIYSFKPIGYSGALSLLAYSLKKIPWVGTRAKPAKVLVDTDDWEGFQGWAGRASRTFLGKLLRDRQERLCLRYCDAVTVVSEALADRVAELRGDRKDVSLVRNGIREDLWPEDRPIPQAPIELRRRLEELGNPPVLLLYTRFVEFTAERLFDIFRRVLVASPDAVLLIVGTSVDERSRLRRLELQSLANDAGVGDHIINCGWVPYDDLLGVWSLATVAIYPCDATAVNRAKSSVRLLELLAAEKPVVADNVGTVRELIVNDNTGLLVEPDGSQAFAEAVVSLLADEELRLRLGSAARKLVYNAFTWSEIVKKVEQAIESGDEQLPGSVEGTSG